MSNLHCAGCLRTPAEIDAYVTAAEDEGITPDDYVWMEEGTLNTETFEFLCDACYIAAGMPLGVVNAPVCQYCHNQFPPQRKAWHDAGGCVL